MKVCEVPGAYVVEMPGESRQDFFGFFGFCGECSKIPGFVFD